MSRPWVITLLGGMQVAYGLVLLALSALIVMVLTRLGDGAATGFLVLAAPVAIVSVLVLACGVGLLQLRPYGRIILIVSSVLSLLAFPVGTIVGGLLLAYMLTPGMKILFSGRPASSLTPMEEAEVAAARNSAWGRIAGILLVVGLVVMVAAFGIVGVGGVAAALSGIAALGKPPGSGSLAHEVSMEDDPGGATRTQSDLQSIATGLLSYSIDHDSLPAASDIDGVAAALTPTYVSDCPRVDAWGNPLRYETWGRGTRDEGFAVASAGSDGAWQHASALEYVPAIDSARPGADILVGSVLIQSPGHGVDDWPPRVARARPEAAVPGEPAAQLHLESWIVRAEGDRAVLEGAVLNPSHDLLSGAVAAATFVDEQGRPVKRGETVLEDLAPGARATFRVTAPLHPAILTAQVTFKDSAGAALVVSRSEAAEDPLARTPDARDGNR